MQTGQPETFQFVSLYTHAQAPLLAGDEAKHLLLAKLQEAKARLGIYIAAYVLLDDHMHFLYACEQHHECSDVVKLLCGEFVRAWSRMGRTHNDTPFWNPNIKAYAVSLGDELRIHLDFIHYDAVRHGLVNRAAAYAWSSLPARVHQGHYPDDWAVLAPPAGVAKVARALYLAQMGKRPGTRGWTSPAQARRIAPNADSESGRLPR